LRGSVAGSADELLKDILATDETRMNTAKNRFTEPAAWNPWRSAFICGPLLMFLLGSLAGCVSRQTAQERAARAYEAGRQNAIQQQMTTQQQGPVVTLKGNVRNRVVPWHDTLTLSQAIVAAQYAGRLNPTAISVHRGGQAYPVSVRMLMSGFQDMPLEPGDVVEIR